MVQESPGAEILQRLSEHWTCIPLAPELFYHSRYLDHKEIVMGAQAGDDVPNDLLGRRECASLVAPKISRLLKLARPGREDISQCGVEFRMIVRRKHNP